VWGWESIGILKDFSEILGGNMQIWVNNCGNTIIIKIPKALVRAPCLSDTYSTCHYNLKSWYNWFFKCTMKCTLGCLVSNTTCLLYSSDWLWLWYRERECMHLPSWECSLCKSHTSQVSPWLGLVLTPLCNSSINFRNASTPPAIYIHLQGLNMSLQAHFS